VSVLFNQKNNCLLIVFFSPLIILHTMKIPRELTGTITQIWEIRSPA
jgi:hypothetical protein